MNSPQIKSIFRNSLLLTISFAIFCLIAEAGLRITHSLKSSTIELDDRLGWRTVPNLDLMVETEDSSGLSSTVRIRTDSNGFRVYDATSDEVPRVLVIGDSFTFGKDVSQESTYYAHLQKAIGGAFFVYGGEGYNTQQEYFILDEYIDAVQPDLVILQFCWNDFIANSPDLERQSYWNNNGYRRPYPTESGEVVYENPKGSLHTFAMRYSRLLYSVVYRADMALGWSHPETTIEDILETEGANHEGLQQSATRTLAILKKFKARCGAVPVYAFTTDDLEPYYNLSVNICSEADIEFIPGIGEALRNSEVEGHTTKAGDGAHWNAYGHEVCSKVLSNWLTEKLSL